MVTSQGMYSALFHQATKHSSVSEQEGPIITNLSVGLDYMRVEFFSASKSDLVLCRFLSKTFLLRYWGGTT